MRLGPAILIPILALAATCLAPASSRAVQPDELRYHHPWGRCGVGSSQTVRRVTEQFNEQGQVTNVKITETQTTLKAISAVGVTLQTEAWQQSGANRFRWDPQEITQAFSGAMPNQAVNRKLLPPTTLTINGRKLLCQQDEVELLKKDKKQIDRLYYNDLSPLILKRTSEITDLVHANSQPEASESQVIELDMPYKVLAEIKTASLLRTVRTNPSGTTTTLAWHVAEVPGEIVFSTLKQTDPQGRLTQLSVMELSAYNFQPLPQPEPQQRYVPLRHRNNRRAP